MNLWKYLLILNKNQEQKQQGFTIPLILGLGLFMLLTGITAIKMGSNSETSSKLQKTSSQALAAAETGLARLQSLVDTYRPVAVYPDCAGTRNATTGACPDTGTVLSWANARAIATVTSTTVCGNTSSSTAITLLESLASTIEWQDITPGKPADGQFRLVSYAYNPTANASKPPGMGTLVVEGRTSQGVAKATKNSKAYNTGVARIRADIPVQENIKSYTGSVPGLWIKYNNSTNMASDKVNGDILVDGCLVPGGVGSSNLVNPATQKVSFNPDPMPDTLPLPAPEFLIGDGVPSADNTPANDPAITSPYTNYPRNGDDPVLNPKNGKYYYHYLMPQLNSNGGETITISAGANVIFYLQGNLNLGGGPTINMQPNGNTPSNLQIYGNTEVPPKVDGSPGGLNGTKFKYGGTSATTQMFFNGTPNVKALIHAPVATGGVAGGGDAGSASFQGTMWISNWDPQSNNSKVKIDAVGQLSDLVSTTTTTKVEPQITVTSSWERQGVN